jgi:glycerol-3-phosphate dehydrogenase
MPADGDILVPIRTVSAIGTTDIRAVDPDEIPVTQAEVEQMLDDGERLVPGLRQARALRVWSGVRPLWQDDRQGEATKDTRDVSRTHAVVDHRERDGISGLLTMSGGKLTTFRLMAQDLVDAMCRQLGDERPCTTDSASPPGAAGEHMRIGDRLRAREEKLQSEQLICECELVGRGALEESMRATGTTHLDDLRRRLRLGMGPCQGGFCIYRATGILHGLDRLDGHQASTALLEFLQERWKGVWPILYGDQLRQARLDDWIFQGVLDLEHLPEAPPAIVAPDGEPARA